MLQAEGIFYAIQRECDKLVQIISTVVEDHDMPLAVFTLTIFIWGLWWLFRFIVTPIFYPHDPKELPYLVPFLGKYWLLGRGNQSLWSVLISIAGHLLGFFYNSNALLIRARQYFNSSREPFALTIAGEKSYFITDANHVGHVYRNMQTLSYEDFVQAMMCTLGNSESSVRTMFTPLPRDKEGFPNPHGKSLGLLSRDMHIHQLFPGDNLTFLERRFHEFFHENIRIERFEKQCPYTISKTKEGIVLPLTQWCSDYVVKAGQLAYFGSRLADIDPGLTDAFLVFDELSHQMIYQYPSFLCRKMLAARDRVLTGLTQYLRLPSEERKDEAWFVGAMEKELAEIGVGERDVAVVAITTYWAINTNTRKSVYWLLAHILQSPHLIEIVRQETAPAILADGSVDLERLHGSTPQLDNMWKEMLRLAAFAASVRIITEDTILGNKVLRKGSRLIIPFRELHMDESVYGPGVETFQPERFSKNPKLNKSNNYSYRPFGGGTTACPGRHIAKRAVYLFVALTLHRFDVEIVGDKKRLEPDLTTPVPGLMSVKQGGEILVKLVERH